MPRWAASRRQMWSAYRGRKDSDEGEFCKIPLLRRMPVGEPYRFGEPGDIEQRVGGVAQSFCQPGVYAVYNETQVPWSFRSSEPNRGSGGAARFCTMQTAPQFR